MAGIFYGIHRVISIEFIIWMPLNLKKCNKKDLETYSICFPCILPHEIGKVGFYALQIWAVFNGLIAQKTVYGILRGSTQPHEGTLVKTSSKFEII